MPSGKLRADKAANSTCVQALTCRLPQSKSELRRELRCALHIFKVFTKLSGFRGKKSEISYPQESDMPRSDVGFNYKYTVSESSTYRGDFSIKFYSQFEKGI